eukprot:sb/3460864/
MTNPLGQEESPLSPPTAAPPSQPMTPGAGVIKSLFQTIGGLVGFSSSQGDTTTSTVSTTLTTDTSMDSSQQSPSREPILPAVDPVSPLAPVDPTLPPIDPVPPLQPMVVPDTLEISELVKESLDGTKETPDEEGEEFPSQTDSLSSRRSARRLTKRTSSKGSQGDSPVRKSERHRRSSQKLCSGEFVNVGMPQSLRPETSSLKSITEKSPVKINVDKVERNVVYSSGYRTFKKQGDQLKVPRKNDPVGKPVFPEIRFTRTNSDLKDSSEENPDTVTTSVPESQQFHNITIPDTQPDTSPDIQSTTKGKTEVVPDSLPVPEIVAAPVQKIPDSLPPSEESDTKVIPDTLEPSAEGTIIPDSQTLHKPDLDSCSQDSTDSFKSSSQQKTPKRTYSKRARTPSQKKETGISKVKGKRSAKIPSTPPDSKSLITSYLSPKIPKLVTMVPDSLAAETLTLSPKLNNSVVLTTDVVPSQLAPDVVPSQAETVVSAPATGLSPNSPKTVSSHNDTFIPCPEIVPSQNESIVPGPATISTQNDSVVPAPDTAPVPVASQNETIIPSPEKSEETPQPTETISTAVQEEETQKTESLPSLPLTQPKKKGPGRPRKDNSAVKRKPERLPGSRKSIRITRQNSDLTDDTTPSQLDESSPLSQVIELPPPSQDTSPERIPSLAEKTSKQNETTMVASSGNDSTQSSSVASVETFGKPVLNPVSVPDTISHTPELGLDTLEVPSTPLEEPSTPLNVPSIPLEEFSTPLEEPSTDVPSLEENVQNMEVDHTEKSESLEKESLEKKESLSLEVLPTSDSLEITAVVKPQTIVIEDTQQQDTHQPPESLVLLNATDSPLISGKRRFKPDMIVIGAITPPKTLSLELDPATPTTPLRTPTSGILKPPNSASPAHSRRVTFGPLPEPHRNPNDPNSPLTPKRYKYRKSPAANKRFVSRIDITVSPDVTSQAIYPELANCTTPANDLIKNLCIGFTMSQRNLNVAKVLSTITTVGDLARLTPAQLAELPFIPPKHTQIRRQLRKFQAAQSPISVESFMAGSKLQQLLDQQTKVADVEKEKAVGSSETEKAVESSETEINKIAEVDQSEKMKRDQEFKDLFYPSWRKERKVSAVERRGKIMLELAQIAAKSGNKRVKLSSELEFEAGIASENITTVTGTASENMTTPVEAAVEKEANIEETSGEATTSAPVIISEVTPAESSEVSSNERALDEVSREEEVPEVVPETEMEPIMSAEMKEVAPVEEDEAPVEEEEMECEESDVVLSEERKETPSDSQPCEVQDITEEQVAGESQEEVEPVQEEMEDKEEMKEKVIVREEEEEEEEEEMYDDEDKENIEPPPSSSPETTSPTKEASSPTKETTISPPKEATSPPKVLQPEMSSQEEDLFGVDTKQYQSSSQESSSQERSNSPEVEDGKQQEGITTDFIHEDALVDYPLTQNKTLVEYPPTQEQGALDTRFSELEGLFKGLREEISGLGNPEERRTAHHKLCNIIFSQMHPSNFDV